MSLERVIFAFSAVAIFVFSNNYKDSLEKYNPYTVKNVAPMKSLVTPKERENSKNNESVAGIHDNNTINHL